MTGEGGEAGFTLAEMLVVLALVALVTAVGAVQFSAARPSRQVAGTLEAVAGELRHARLEAIRSGRAQRLVFDASARTLSGGAGGPLAFPDGMEVEIVTAREAGGGEGAPAILFLPDGRSTGGRVEIAAGGVREVLMVDWLTGLTRSDAP